MNSKLKKYIEEKILPIYEKNDLGHNIDHINYVIIRSLKFAQNISEIDLDMVYTIASYHDIGHYIDAKNHEKVSAEILASDEKLKDFFTTEEIKTMSDAIYDHRASLEYEPRTIYGKIVSSADRNTSIDIPLQRTYAYSIAHEPELSLEQMIERARIHLIDKFGNKGYATEKMYFKDEDYEHFLKEIAILTANKDEFRRRYMKINNLDEYEYYTNNVNPELKQYIEKEIFPQYEKNDKAHGIIHIREVIRRAFELNDTMKLNLDADMIYVIASFHDLGKYINHEIHEKIAADIFFKDEKMKNYFTDIQRKEIKEAIEDHRSSFSDTPRSIYGKLISSADRNSSIEIVFKRSFFVGMVRTPEMSIDDYLDFTFKRLTKRYSEETPENMFFEDQRYKTFLIDMRNLLKNEEQFKKKYCEINNITTREKNVGDYERE